MFKSIIFSVQLKGKGADMEFTLATNGIDIGAYIVEPVVNHEASDYIINNYNALINIIKSYNIKAEKAGDLLHDVYISIVDSENNGMGFNMEYGSTLDKPNDSIINVEQFVIGRINGYSKNMKYSTDVIEATKGYVNQQDVVYDKVLNNDGTVKEVKRKVETHKVQIMMTSNAASYNDGVDVDSNNDNFQKAYATAFTSDSTDDLDDLYSVREQIDYCIDVCNLHGVNILNIFKNIDELANMLGDYSKKKKTSDGVFSKLSKIVEYNDELANSVMDILRFSSANKSIFEEIIATY